MAFNVPVVFFDSVYIIYGKYYPKVFFEKFIQLFWKNEINFAFWGIGSCSCNIKESFVSGIPEYIIRFMKYKKI